jgi:hypothetical protein
LPAEITVDGQTLKRREVFKHDFFAATALYEGPARKVVLKIGRLAPLFLFPLSWLGRLLALKEAAVLRSLHDVEGVPRFIARWGPTGIIREFVEGHPLHKGERVADDFHPRLRRLIDTLHGRGLAYVDLEKCDNVLVGEDGRPYLFDFQISWYLPARWGGELWPMRILRSWLQSSDRYHLLKLQRRTRPDQLPPDRMAASYRKPWYIRVQAVVGRPATRARRAILRWLDPRRTRPGAGQSRAG